MTITDTSLKLFLAFAEDAANWSGTPPAWVSAQERGNLTQLKRAGLVETSAPDERGDAWVFFTDSGKALAAEHGFDLAWVDY